MSSAPGAPGRGPKSTAKKTERFYKEKYQAVAGRWASTIIHLVIFPAPRGLPSILLAVDLGNRCVFDNSFEIPLCIGYSHHQTHCEPKFRHQTCLLTSFGLT